MIIALAQLRADLKRVRLVERCADLLHLILPPAILCGTLLRWVGSLMRKNRAKIEKMAGTWLRETHLAVVMASAMVRSTASKGEAIGAEVLLARLRKDALELGDLVTQ
eukprot:4901945-Pleurochrysis_carterae.AAC.3